MRTGIEKLTARIRDRLWSTGAIARRFIRLLVFGIELVALSRLFALRRWIAPSEITWALLHTKSIRYWPPELSVSNTKDDFECWSEGFSCANAALFLNLHNPDRLSTSRYAHPAPSFRAIYLWDSAFISQVWKWWDPEVAWDILHSVIQLRDGCRLQHFVADFGRSKFTQPPLLDWSLEQLGLVADPAQFRRWAETAFEPLQDYHRWLFAHRQLANGLFAWAHPYESGVENAPRFSSRDERRMKDTRRLAAPDFSAYMVLKSEALAALAHRIGRHGDAAAHEAEAASLRAAVNNHLWDDHEGLYFDRDIVSGEFVKSRTIASLMPLWAGIPGPDRAHRLLEHILEPTAFNSVIPLPSVALSDDSFERDMWRGPVWVNTAFAVIAGLRRYEFHEAASDLAFRLCDGVYRTFRHTGRFHEFYDPCRHDIEKLHRKRGNRWKRVTLGAQPVTDFVGWSGLVNTLVMDVLFGLRRTVKGFGIQPRFPSRAEGLKFSLTLPLAERTVDVEILADGAVSGTNRGPEGETGLEVTFGEFADLEPGKTASAGAGT